MSCELKVQEKESRQDDSSNIRGEADAPFPDVFCLCDEWQDTKQKKQLATDNFRPDLKAEVPARGYIEPLFAGEEGCSLFSTAVRDGLAAEISTLAHNSTTNADAVRFLKKIEKLSKVYAKDYLPPTVSDESVSVPTGVLSALSSSNANNAAAFLESTSDEKLAGFFSSYSDIFAQLPLLGLTSLSAHNAHLSSLFPDEVTRQCLFDNSARDIGDVSTVATLGLNMALARGSLAGAVTVLAAALERKAEISSSSLHKLREFDPLARVKSKEELMSERFLASTGHSITPPQFSGSLTSPDDVLGSYLNDSAADRVKAPVATAAVLSVLERASSSFAPTPAELLYLTGKVARDDSGSQQHDYKTTDSPWPSSPGRTYGISFELHAKKDLTVTGLYSMMKASTSGSELKVWHRQGGCNQDEAWNASGWTLLKHDSNNVLAGTPPYLCTNDISVRCEAGSVHSFYFFRNASEGMEFGASQVDYRSFGPSNEHFELKTGKYTSGSTPFIGAGSPYMFMGSIQYTVGCPAFFCDSCQTVATSNSRLSTNVRGFNVTAEALCAAVLERRRRCGR
jgi:hypothetical protein